MHEFKKNSSTEPLGQFQPNFGDNFEIVKYIDDFKKSSPEPLDQILIKLSKIILERSFGEVYTRLFKKGAPTFSKGR